MTLEGLKIYSILNSLPVCIILFVMLRKVSSQAHSLYYSWIPKFRTLKGDEK